MARERVDGAQIPTRESCACRMSLASIIAVRPQAYAHADLRLYGLDPVSAVRSPDAVAVHEPGARVSTGRVRLVVAGPSVDMLRCSRQTDGRPPRACDPIGCNEIKYNGGHPTYFSNIYSRILHRSGTERRATVTCETSNSYSLQ